MVLHYLLIAVMRIGHGMVKQRVFLLLKSFTALCDRILYAVKRRVLFGLKMM